MTNVKTISIAILIIGALIGAYKMNTIENSFAQNSTQNPIPLKCPKGHVCICTSNTQFIDFTTGQSGSDISCRTHSGQ